MFQRPYFAGQRVCDDGGREWKKEDMICGGCSGADLVASCRTHGKEFMYAVHISRRFAKFLLTESSSVSSVVRWLLSFVGV